MRAFVSIAAARIRWRTRARGGRLSLALFLLGLLLGLLFALGLLARLLFALELLLLSLLFVLGLLLAL